MTNTPGVDHDSPAGGAAMPGAGKESEAQYAADCSEFVGGRVKRFTLREMHGVRGGMVELVVMLALGAVFGWLGPYGTYSELGVAERFAYWMIGIPLIGVPASLAVRMMARIEPTSSWPAPMQAVAGALLAGFPSTFLAIALEAAFREAPAITVAGLVRIYGSVTIIIALIAIPWRLIVARRERKIESGAPGELGEPQPPASPPGTSPFLRRIPPKLGTDLLYIATEDHYLRVATALGNDLILFRLSDAIAELDPALGRQVHRSYWVARAAVEAVERDGHRPTLVLVDGARVPISRTYLKVLRAAGWLDA